MMVSFGMTVLKEEYLLPVAPIRVYERMLSNLSGIYQRDRQMGFSPCSPFLDAHVDGLISFFCCSHR